MKIVNKLILLFIIIIINNSLLKGQDTSGETQLVYTYDANGNRLTRTPIDVTLLSKSVIIDSTQNKNNTLINNASSNFKINIAPNPTTSFVNVTVQSTDVKEKFEFEYTITSITGALIQKNKVSANSTDIDLSGIADGVYLLKLTTNNKNFIYKIVKAN
ncbi:MAG: T9SS type A sorting domain-containing protein [Bacteroidota bacterium]